MIFKWWLTPVFFINSALTTLGFKTNLDTFPKFWNHGQAQDYSKSGWWIKRDWSFNQDFWGLSLNGTLKFFPTRIIFDQTQDYQNRIADIRKMRLRRMPKYESGKLFANGICTGVKWIIWASVFRPNLVLLHYWRMKGWKMPRKWHYQVWWYIRLYPTGRYEWLKSQATNLL